MRCFTWFWIWVVLGVVYVCRRQRGRNGGVPMVFVLLVLPMLPLVSGIAVLLGLPVIIVLPVLAVLSVLPGVKSVISANTATNTT